MKKIFDEKCTIAAYELEFGANPTVMVQTITQAWFASTREVLVIEHTTEIEGDGHKYLGRKVRDRMADAPEFKHESYARFFVRHLKTVATPAEAIRLAVKSADDYGVKIGELAAAAWKAIETAQNEEQERIRESNEEWEAKRATGYGEP